MSCPRTSRRRLPSARVPSAAAAKNIPDVVAAAFKTASKGRFHHGSSDPRCGPRSWAKRAKAGFVLHSQNSAKVEQPEPAELRGTGAFRRSGALCVRDLWRRNRHGKDVVCGMQVDPAKAAGGVVQRRTYTLLEGLQDEVRRESRPIRQVAPTLGGSTALAPRV